MYPAAPKIAPRISSTEYIESIIHAKVYDLLLYRKALIYKYVKTATKHRYLQYYIVVLVRKY